MMTIQLPAVLESVWGVGAVYWGGTGCAGAAMGVVAGAKRCRGGSTPPVKRTRPVAAPRRERAYLPLRYYFNGRFRDPN